MTYFAWKADPAGGFCTLEGIRNLENPYELGDGIQYGDAFPDDARFHMNLAHPKDIKLADNIYNLRGVLVVSKQLKAFVAPQNPPSTEFLPVTIINHKGRVASEEYFVINPYEVVDCIDTEASEIVWSSIVPDKISSCLRLVLDESAIDPSLLLFRLRYKTNVVLVKQELADALRAEGFAGLRFVPTAELIL